jgi:hypothetical protein
VLCYKLDYVGERTVGQVVGALHIAVCLGAFLFLPTGAIVYLVVAAAEVVVLAAVLLVCRRAWRAPEYTFFWRHAQAW